MSATRCLNSSVSGGWEVAVWEMPLVPDDVRWLQEHLVRGRLFTYHPCLMAQSALSLDWGVRVVSVVRGTEPRAWSLFIWTFPL